MAEQLVEKNAIRCPVCGWENTHIGKVEEKPGLVTIKMWCEHGVGGVGHEWEECFVEYEGVTFKFTRTGEVKENV
jgi:hypothetical protein